MTTFPSLISCKLTDIASVERTKKDYVYPAGTIYIQVSACKRNSENAWMILTEDSTLEDKYAVILPTIKINPEYLKYSIESVSEEWHERYVGTNINISMGAFKYLVINYNPDTDEQEKVVKKFKDVEMLIEAEQNIINKYKGVKEWYLDKLFP